MGEFRLQRVEKLLREEIGLMILTDEVRDPRVNSFVTVTDVQVSKDLRYAKVYVSSFQSAEHLRESVSALNHAAGFVQGRIGRKLKLRETPRLTFLPDASIRRGVEISHKIEDINH